MTHLTTIECPTCLTTFHGVEVESDGEMSYAILEARPCAECGAPLCEHCARFACAGCGETFCREHAVTVEDGTDKPLLCCAACAAECEDETEPVCPACGSDRVIVDMFHFGIEAQTGYDNSGELFACRACGAKGEAAELVRRAAVEPLPARREPARETREAAKRSA